MASTLRAAESTLGAIARIADEAPSAQDLLEAAAERIRRVVPHDGAFFSSTDPETTLASGLGMVSDLPLAWCQPTWDYELLVPDAVKFADIARGDRAVADVHDATGGRPDRSPRFRHYASDTGFRAELRMAFTAGDGAWGIAQINRAGTGARFTADEKAWLERVAPHVARGLRRTLLTTPATAATRGPGVVVLDRAGGVVSATSEATEWLGELHPALLTGGGPDLPLPFHAHGFAARVRAAHEDGEPRLRARLRTRAGVWVLMHGSPLQGTDLFALIIEPAKASDVAPLIVEAYGLSQRELDVTRAIARGLKTAEIAAHLHLSPHTVRDHVKAVFEKVGVSGRGELVHKVFAEHYAFEH
jgi:DNA-binding CsgD family transcriptional regulator